ncbi:MAG: hypothetical protein BroJett038_00430 [Chloroflexota bacterium]|nr:MAG: hypothetical protein BroJett038_00430 [Chloroflexota bacterium]
MSDKICFVISPIGEDGTEIRTQADRVLERIIKPSVESFGYKPVRADQIAKPGDITTEIIQCLIKDDLVIADLTGYNPNVFYELAIRHATRKPVITILRLGETIPFDLLHYRTIFYDTGSETGISDCITKMKEQIRAIDIDSEKIINPVSAAIDIEELSRRKDPLERRYDQLDVTLKELIREINELKARTPYQDLIDNYRDEIDMLRTFREAGIISTYRRREMALKRFIRAIKAEKNEIMIIGSSLLGLLQKYQYEEAREALKKKCEEGIHVKFLLTHPAVADLRADQEARKFKDIGNEIIKSLRILKQWKLKELPLPADNVRLYMGTPTIFAIKTTNQMLLNPYAYGDVAFNSPCLIVKNDPNEYFYFYDEYDKAHFGAWDSDAVIRIQDFDETIQELSDNLEMFERNIQTIRESVRKNQEPQPAAKDAAAS